MRQLDPELFIAGGSVSEAQSKVTLRPRSKLERVIDELSDRYEVPSRSGLDVLSHVAIVLLMNGGADAKSASVAISGLCSRAGRVDPDRLATTSRDAVASVCKPGRVDAVVEALRVAGQLAVRLSDGLDARCRADLAEARALLGTLPGLCEQRADVVLLYAGAQAVVAPTSIGAYVAARLGYPGSTYASLARSLDAELPSFGATEFAWRAHHVLDRHGRDLCLRASPHCGRCPVRSSCAHHGEGDDPAARLQLR